MLGAWISAALSFMSPYCSRARASNYSDAFIKSFLVCIDGQVVVGEKYFAEFRRAVPKQNKLAGLHNSWIFESTWRLMEFPTKGEEQQTPYGGKRSS